MLKTASHCVFEDIVSDETKVNFPIEQDHTLKSYMFKESGLQFT